MPVSLVNLAYLDTVCSLALLFAEIKRDADLAERDLHVSKNASRPVTYMYYIYIYIYIYTTKNSLNYTEGRDNARR